MHGVRARHRADRAGRESGESYAIANIEPRGRRAGTHDPRADTNALSPPGTHGGDIVHSELNPDRDAGGGNARWQHRVPSEAQEVAVRRIVDGDTLKFAALAAGVALASTAPVEVRLLEIDTPETKDPSEPVQCYGKKATRALERLLPPGSRAWVQRDEDLRDPYGRYLLYVWNADGVFVNLRMVQRGYARAVLYEPNDRHWSEISAAERKVRRADKGVWSACSRFGAPHNPPAPEPDTHDEPREDGRYPVPPPPPDRDCSEITDTDFRVRTGDPHDFDRDGDGIGCESDSDVPADPPEPPAPPEPPVPKPEPDTDDEAREDGRYPVPPPPPDRDCSEITDTDFRVRTGDPHDFDRDGDGIGCES